MTLKAILHEEDGGFWAEVPALRGCYSQGRTIEEVRINLAEAVRGYLETFAEEMLSGLTPSGNGGLESQVKLFEVVV